MTATETTFTEPRVFTITCTARAGVDIADLDALAAAVTIAAGAVGVAFCRGPSGAVRGAAPAKRPPQHSFGRQITMGVRCASQPERDVHVKLFGNGTLQIAGCLRADAGYEAAELTCAACGFVAPPVDLVVRMINCGFRASHRLNLAACVGAARGAGLMATYDPCCYSALKLSLFFGLGGDAVPACRCATHCATKKPSNRLCRMVVVSLFESGAIGVSGATTQDHVRRAGDVVRDLVRRCPGARQLADDEVLVRLRQLAGASETAA